MEYGCFSSMTHFPVRAHQTCEKVWFGEVGSKGRWLESMVLSLEPRCGCHCPRAPGPLPQTLWGTLPIQTRHEHSKFPTYLKIRVFKMCASYSSFFQSNVLYASQLTKCLRSPCFFIFPFSRYAFNILPFLRQWLIQPEIPEFGGEHNKIRGIDSKQL